MNDVNNAGLELLLAILWLPQLLSFWWAAARVNRGKSSLMAGYMLLYLPTVLYLLFAWWVVVALLLAGSFAILIVFAPTLLFTFLLPFIATPSQQ